MSDLGQILRKARMDAKISLDDLQESTKIRKRYLEAIEEGNYKVLPGSFYVRAFIKSYAEAVGLDPTEVLKMYETTNPSPTTEQPAVETIRKKRASSRHTDKMSRWASGSMMIAFVVLILGVVYYFAYQNYKGTPAEDNPAQTQSPRITDRTDSSPGVTGSSTASGTNQGETLPSTAPTATPTPSPTPTPAVSVQFVSSEKNVDTYAVTGSDKLNIQLKITGAQCWIQVDALTADNKRVMQKQKLYKNGDSDSFELDSSAYLNIGAASTVELNVNGVVVTVGDTPNPKKVRLNLQKS
ncbi:helix-turn-helix domain-containing protein [Paenibacillus athensensis]|uniref:Helix-turn-helix domain-containing protein n=1 Tax=Paenibacillus athensensis TaxID=1967502 RepID=A0A4Y8QBZ7_9BACL|nr:RodZ domain-containing protein [Paenibacillus athensensis]MCD1257749.1 helix-turn-helix domain-containing protein [Paenibacillus athensensis]